MPFVSLRRLCVDKKVSKRYYILLGKYRKIKIQEDRCMDKGGILTKLQTMTLEEKLTLLSDTDKAYIQNYLNQAAPEFRPQKQNLRLKTKRLKEVFEKV
jgi:hypothetical protein